MSAPRPAARGQRGGFAVGLVVGVLLGLAVALAVALYITRAPIPFIDKVPQRTAEQDSAEAERNRNWDPNATLGMRQGPRVPAPEAAASAPADGSGAAVAAAPGAKPPAPAAGTGAPAGGAPGTVAGATAAKPGADPFHYFVQAGAFTRPEDAEQQRAKLALLGLEPRIDERAVSGRTLHRVRLGPYPTRDAADAQQQRLQEGGIEAQIVRVEKQP